jgi:apolipoprotein N-acyltransferase
LPEILFLMLQHDLKKIWLILLSVLSGVLLAAAWPARGFPGLLFIGLIPLLFIEDHISVRREKFFRFSVLLYSYPAFFTWNLLTTWWIVNSTTVGAAMAIVINSFFMALVFQAFHFSKKHLKSAASGYAALIFYWISFEYLHLNWNLNWPWLNLGNGFASFHKWVQWYEYTGAIGGTLWVLVANIAGYKLMQDAGCRMQDAGTGGKSVIRYLASGRRHLYALILFHLWILLPICISYYIYRNYKEDARPVHVVVVQPNFDPYSEQYTVPPQQVLARIMELGFPMVDSTTDFLIAPESAIQEDMWENDLSTFYTLPALRQYVAKYPGLNIIVGGSTFRYYRPGEKVPYTARKFRDAEEYYNAYNAAIMVNALDSLQLYHKSKLTPGVETLPSFRGLKWLERFAIDLGGTVGSLGTDDLRKVYRTVNTVPASAVICYESVFGEFFAEFVKNGAEVMFIITNDGWWGNSGGYRQHFSFASLRAIETRRSIARSANTGISAFIDQRGDDHQKTPYWKPAAIKGSINANSTITFYTRNGDYLARMSVALMVIIFLMSVGMVFINSKVKSQKSKL